MDKILLKKINETVYKEKLENGLEIIIFKTKNFKKKSAFFQTRYGSINNEFIPFGKTTFKKYPLGIAHFLEHKLFESDSNDDIFKSFQKDGAYVNAATSYDKTYYYFVCTKNFDKNLIRLIDMVESPYFTDENVEKEKGIIGQEIDMYQNKIGSVIYEKLYYNAFINHPIKYDIAGSKNDIKKITKEDLYECYNTFYNPSNMFLVIVGDIDVDKTIKLIKENQDKKIYKKEGKIKIKKDEEPKIVSKEKEIIKRNVTSTKIGYAYKIILDELPAKESYKRRFFLNTFIKCKFGELTGFTEDLIQEKIVKSYFDYYVDVIENFLILSFTADVLDEEKLDKKIEDKLLNLEDMKENFELYKKSSVSNYYKIFETPSDISAHLRTMYNNYKTIIDDCPVIIENAKYEEFISFIKSLDFKNKTKVIVNKK